MVDRISEVSLVWFQRAPRTIGLPRTGYGGNGRHANANGHDDLFGIGPAVELVRDTGHVS